MISCEVCGRECAEVITVSVGAGPAHRFDCLRCAELRLAPTCHLCGRRVVDRPVRVDGEVYCSAGCAEQGRARAGWLPGPGEGDLDPVGTTPPRIGAPMPALPRPRNGRGAPCARVGDRIVVRSRRVEAPPRDGEVIEVRSADGGPPYLVRWSDTGHVALYFPGPDAVISTSEVAETAD